MREIHAALPPSSRWASAGHVVGLAVIYWLTGQLGLLVGSEADAAGVVWPAAGVAVAVLLGQSQRRWAVRPRRAPAVEDGVAHAALDQVVAPTEADVGVITAGAQEGEGEQGWLAMGVYAGALSNNLMSGMSVVTAAVVAAGSCVAALAAAHMLRRARLHLACDRLSAVAKLILIGGLGASAVSATWGVSVLTLAGRLQRPALAWVSWWLGDTLGVLIVVPVLCLWWALPWPRFSRRDVLEAAALGTLLIAACTLIFLQSAHPAALFPPVLYLLFPILLTAAVRFGQRGGATAVAVMALMAVAGTAADLGPFAGDDRIARLMSLQFFLAIVVSSMLILGAVIEERRQAIRVRDDFLRVASHELKTPLAALQLALDNLGRLTRSGGSPQAMQRKLVVCQQQVYRLGRLAEDLVDVGHLSRHGTLLLHRHACDLADITRQAMARLDDACGRAGCVWQSDLTPAQGLWDGERVTLMVTHMLDNALKFGAGKPVTVRVYCTSEHACLQIRDHGIGIALEHRERIFDRFGRAVSTRNYGGLGLSLYISRRIVLAHGGALRVESQPGQGACFTVELPVAHPGAGHAVSS